MQELLIELLEPWNQVDVSTRPERLGRADAMLHRIDDRSRDERMPRNWA